MRSLVLSLGSTPVSSVAIATILLRLTQRGVASFIPVAALHTLDSLDPATILLHLLQRGAARLRRRRL